MWRKSEIVNWAQEFQSQALRHPVRTESRIPVHATQGRVHQGQVNRFPTLCAFPCRVISPSGTGDLTPPLVRRVFIGLRAPGGQVNAMQQAAPGPQRSNVLAGSMLLETMTQCTAPARPGGSGSGQEQPKPVPVRLGSV